MRAAAIRIAALPALAGLATRSHRPKQTATIERVTIEKG
jgi:hypothetical protein